MYSQVPAHDFPGLDLRSSPDESGCIDCLNVDFDRVGAVRTRDGYDNFTSSAAAGRYLATFPFVKTDGTSQLLTVRGTTIEALDSSGGSIATQAYTIFIGVHLLNAVRFGAPGSQLLFLGGENNANTLRTWNGTAFAVNAMGSVGYIAGLVGISPTDNRIAIYDLSASGTSATGRVRFSGAGAPTSWGANDYVDLSPGDGDTIVAMATWQDMLFVFKSSKYFVFYGNTTDADGVTEFNYRPISSGIGTWSPRSTATAPEGVYFFSYDGIYITKGGYPERVSDPVTPLFTGDNVPSFFQSSAMNWAASAQISMTYLNGRLYASYPSGSSTTADRMLVYDTATERWTLWDIAANGLSNLLLGNRQEVVFGYATGSNHIGRHSSAYTTDDGTAITWRHRSGFTDFGSDVEKRIVKTRLFGTGSVDVKWSRDFGSLGSAKTATLGVSPAIAQAVVDGNSPKGRVLSWQLGGSGRAAVYRCHHELDPSAQPDTRTT